MKKLADFFTDNRIILSLVVLGILFFYKFVFLGKIPIPSDALVGLYYPFRDTLTARYPNGYPYKNPLITDPVRQQYVWRELVIDAFKKGELPLWNPYSFSGTPLLANFQSGAFYPLNILFFILSFPVAWGVLIALQPILSLVFMYLYLRELKITKSACIIGSLAFSFSGFSISWLTWNTIGHTILWLPLILFLFEKILKKSSLVAIACLIFAISSSFFAGHLQTFFYMGIFSLVYLLFKVIVSSGMGAHSLKKLSPFILVLVITIIITSLQWIPGFKFISESARSVDQGSWLKEGWFIPVQNLFQFFAPDFFGNPATGNYYGIWNYGEFVGYVGLVPLFFALYAAIKLRDKKSMFFLSAIILAVLFATQNPVSEIPYRLSIPFISTSQPTRLMSVIDFSLAVLAALGVDQLRRNVQQKVSVLFSLGIIIFLLSFWIFTQNAVTRNNLYLSILLGIIVLIATQAYRIKPSRILLPIFLFATVFDLFRFGWKFTPFTGIDLLYPKSIILNYIEEHADNYRVMAADRRILPPNVSAHYKLQDVAGYDPLYLLSYNKFVSVWNSSNPDIQASAFNRIVTPQNYTHNFANILGVKYLLSLSPVEDHGWKFVLRDGETYLYENTANHPRVYLAYQSSVKSSEKEMFEAVLEDTNRDTVFTEESIVLGDALPTGIESAKIINYRENYIEITAHTDDTRMVVLTDPWYPSWHAYMDGKETKIYKVNFLFRGVVVPKGNHVIEFKNTL